MRWNRRHRQVVSTASIAALAALALACSGKSSDGASASDSSTGTETSDDDFIVADAVPMSLIGAEFLAKLDAKLTPAVARGAFEPASSDDGEHERTEAILETSGRAAGEMKSLLTNVRGVFSTLVGEGSFFGTEPVKIREGTSERLFKTESTADGAVRYIAVSLLGEDGPFRYRVELFTEADDADSMEASTTIEFKPIEGDDGDAKVRFFHAQPTTKGTQRIVADYRLSKREITTAYGFETPATTTPARTVAHFAVDPDGRSATVDGGIVWRGFPQPEGGLTPRYFAPADGDVEAFLARSRLTAKAETAQLGAFIPASKMAAVDYSPDATVFDDYPYAKSMLEFLRGIVREESVSQGFCAAAGQTFRDAFTAETMPQSVKDAPANLCASGPATNAQVEAVIDDTCAAGKDIAVPVQDASGNDSEKRLCGMLTEARLLDNPQLLYTQDSVRRLVQPGETPLPEHADLVDEVEALALTDLSPLAETTWSALTKRSAADFANADPKP